MSDELKAIEDALEVFGSAPTLADMPRRSLSDKGIHGPTAAHVIEEVHTPFNLAYLTFTTGSSAFQTIVGVTYAELPDRSAVARELFERLNLEGGARMLVTYPPLVNVFSKQALDDCGVEWSHLLRSSRDALIVAACRQAPQVILGESSFLRASLEQVLALGLKDEMPKGCVLLCAGTPLDQELIPVAAQFGYSVHDLYGCQEFGWLVLDGVPLRPDVSLVPSPRGEGWRELVVGGLPMGDSFLVSSAGHVCNRAGQIITYRRERTYPEYEVVVTHTTASAADTIDKAARTILRIKSRVVKVAPDLVTGAEATRLELVPGAVGAADDTAEKIVIEGPQATTLFDAMVTAQREMSRTAKTDPAWVKRR
ncbi:acyl carrier protein [Rhodobacter sp. TJ_12]|uniref:acyl carrier protein n=1 Tax=Rhodobacter sp. TJ_12 TaxID=2029399 RepID=UPI001CC1A28C|nr:acyl carrier protein [Rhodobacter sp. TJ_12]MBZ4020868.1 acyl carrier protein [Rhodobacter sp. TJ_12]